MSDASRRNFMKGLGLSGLFLAGINGYKEVKERIVYKQDELPTKELEEKLNEKPVLQLTATYGTPKPKPTIPWYQINQQYYIAGSNGFGDDYVEGTRKDVKVNIVPGPDGKLYVKENDTWRKI
jgi:lysozyme family protein